jgi:predicted HTH domain antitoxin
MVIQPETLVNARLYPNREAVIQDALRALLQEKPQLRLELAIYRYQTEDISLAKAARLAGVTFDHMKTLLVQRGIQPRLGPADVQEAQQEIAAMEDILGEQKEPLMSFRAQRGIPLESQ